MKKILLIIAITFLIFQMVVLATEITIGSAAINRAGYYQQNTWVDRGSTANGTGTITEVQIYAKAQMEGATVATFFVVSGNNLTARDSEIVDNGSGAGVVLVGQQTFTVNLDVEIGDYIGLYFGPNGQLEVDVSGNGEWHKAGDQTGCTNTTFILQADRTLSLYGTGTTEEEEVNVIFFGTAF